MTREQKRKCRLIIHGASAAAGAMGAGLAQVVAADNVVIVPIQVTMVISLGRVFDVKLSKAAAEAAALSTAATLVGRATSQVLVGWIPVIGNAINAVTAASITEAMGWAVAGQFEKGLLKDG
ncbi:MAG TPA: hypothetical protein VIM62_03045 [Acidobacteriaceae bacterium]